MLGLGHDAAGITHHTDLMRLCHASDNALKPTPPPSLAANHSKCQTDSLMRTRPFVPDPRFRPSEERVSRASTHGALHRISVRISVSVLFRFYISFFVSVSVYIVSVRQRTLTNADDR